MNLPSASYAHFYTLHSNFGDILYGLVLKKLISNTNSASNSIHTCGVFREKSRRLGVKIDASPAHLSLKDPKYSQVFIGGGAIFRSRFYPSAISHFSENAFCRQFFSVCLGFRFSKILLYRILDVLMKAYMGKNFVGPFLYVGDPSKVRYVSVGFSTSISSLTSHNLRRIINSSRSIYCRDLLLYEFLVKQNFQADKILYGPDIVFAISDFYDHSLLCDKVSDDSMRSLGSDFIVVQANSKFIKSIDQISDRLEELRADFGVKYIVCLPFAKVHGDLEFSRALASTLTHCIHYENPSLFEILYLLSRSKMFVGSSMHGCIVSYSYGNMFLPIDNQMPKIVQMVKTILHPRAPVTNHFNTPIPNILGDFGQVITFNSDLAKNLKYVKAAALSTFRHSLGL